MAIAGVILTLGYGKEMLAGYNTATNEQRNKYNEKRLLRISGIALLSTAALVAVVFYLLDQQQIGIVALLVIPFLPILIAVPIMNSKYVKIKP